MKLKNTILVLGCTLFCGCLDMEPISEIGEDSFYKNDDEVNAGVVACYNGLHNTMEYEWMLTDLRTDVSRVRSKNSETSQSKDLMAFDESKTSAILVQIEDYWNANYNNIARCNTVLQYLGNVSDETLRKQYEGEALFLRSYHYFNMVRLFGPVFLVTERISAFEAKLYNRSSVEDVYAQIEADLKNVVDNQLLPASYDDNDLGRVTLWSAKTLLAKVYLTEHKYSEAKALLADVMTNDGSLDLETNYADVFSTTNEMNKEIIFAVRYKSGNVGLGNPFGNRFAPLNSNDNVINGDGSSYNYPTQKLMNAYEAGDTRKDVTVADHYVNSSTGLTVNECYVAKWVSPVTTKEDGEKDIPVLRYADVLLMYAEAENELNGPTADALKCLNRVHTRAGLAALTSADVPNKYRFRLALEDERYLEFAYENQRFFDLVRTDRYIPVMNEHYQTELKQNSTQYYYSDDNGFFAGPVEEWQLLLPIPTSEIDVNPGVITQNPGY